MRTLFYFIATALVIVSCKTKPEVDYAIIRGTITNTDSESLSLQAGSQNISIAINRDGTFIDTLKVIANNFNFIEGSYFTSLYIEPGNDINLTYDHNNYSNTVNFTGTGAEINNYLFSRRKKTKEVEGDFESLYKLNEIDFKSKRKQVEVALLNLLENTKGLPKSFREKEKRNIKYMSLSGLLIYESYHASYTNTPDFKVSETFFEELQDLDFNNEEDYNFSFAYLTLIKNHFFNEAEKLSKFTSTPKDVAYLKSVSNLSNPFIKNDLLYEYAKKGIEQTSDVEGYYKAFIAASTNELHKAELTERYNSLKVLAKGSTSPKFINFENSAGGITSLDDFKGKYVYIDLWATWCVPCKAEIPFLQKVESQYHGKNIEFVSISLDKPKDHDKWKNMVANEGMKGVQLIANNAFESQFVQDYQVKYIPRFILIDPMGVIVSPNAPRPSQMALIDLFNELKI